MKKQLLALGAIVSTGAPVAAVVACDDKGTQQAPLSKKHNVTQDGFYLEAQDYSGVFWNNKTKKMGNIVKKERIQLPGKGQNAWTSNVIEIGNGDSVHLLFNDDDKDGISPDNILKELFYNDTSIMNDKMIKELNKSIGHLIDKDNYNTTDVSFEGNLEKGHILPYIGQNNHSSVSFDDALTKIKDQMPNQFEAITHYYGVLKTPDKNGHFPDDITIRNHSNRGFIPTIYFKDYITYNKVSDRDYKITFHTGKATRATAQHLSLRNLSTNKFDYFGTLSIGDKDEWNAYERQQQYKYLGRQKVWLS